MHFSVPISFLFLHLLYIYFACFAVKHFLQDISTLYDFHGKKKNLVPINLFNFINVGIIYYLPSSSARKVGPTLYIWQQMPHLHFHSHKGPHTYIDWPHGFLYVSHCLLKISSLTVMGMLPTLLTLKVTVIISPWWPEWNSVSPNWCASVRQSWLALETLYPLKMCSVFADTLTSKGVSRDTITSWPKILSIRSVPPKGWVVSPVAVKNLCWSYPCLFYS